MLRSFLTFCCVLYGCVVTFSRVADHRHHLTDVLAGAALGTAASVIMVRDAVPQRLNEIEVMWLIM